MESALIVFRASETESYRNLSSLSQFDTNSESETSISTVFCVSICPLFRFRSWVQRTEVGVPRKEFWCDGVTAYLSVSSWNTFLTNHFIYLNLFSRLGFAKTRPTKNQYSVL